MNINAPLAGTFNPALPTSGVRPLGQSAGNILQYQSDGRSQTNNLSFSTSGTIKKIGFWATYSWNKSRSIDNGSSGSPFNPYDFINEWGRANYDVRHRFYSGAYYQTKSGWSANTFIVGIARGEQRFRDFAERLRQRTCKEVVLWDEALTTVEAAEQLEKSGKSRREAERDIDMIAAAVILQSYLDQQRRQS